MTKQPCSLSGVFLGLWALSGHQLAGHGDSIPPSIFWPQAPSPDPLPPSYGPFRLSQYPPKSSSHSWSCLSPIHQWYWVNSALPKPWMYNCVSPVKHTSVLLIALKNQARASLPPLLPPSLPLPFPLRVASLHGSWGLKLFILSSFATLLMPS